jgi:hypothetical protein
MLFGHWENSDESLNRLRCVDGVQCREDEMTSFCRFHCDLDGFTVSHLSHKNHFGSLAQCRPQSKGEAGGIAMQFTLMDNAVFVGVQELDGILDGEHMIGLLFVNFVDDSRQGR